MDRKKLIAFLLCFVTVLVSGSDDEGSSNVMRVSKGHHHPRALLKYNTQQAEKNKTDEDYIAYDLAIVVEAIAKLNNSKCGEDAMVVMGAMSRRERWAIKMFDASSKFPVGLLYGNFYQMGNFDECIGIKQPFMHSNEERIKGQYCLANVELHAKKNYDGRVARSFLQDPEKPRNLFNSTMYWSICVPSSCTVKEVETAIKEILVLATEQKQIVVRLEEDRCYVEKSVPFTTLEKIYCAVIIVFVLFTFAATIFHYCILQQKKKDRNVESGAVNKKNLLKEAIICFSLIKSIGKFLSTKSSPLNLECICGIRFISMVFIILGHSCLFMVGGPVQNTDFYDRETRSLMNAIFTNSPLLVDTFLLVGAFLLCYLLLLELDKRRGKVNILALYIGRYIRLTPSYLIVIGFYCTLFTRISDGPLWNSKIKLEQERCQKSWWTNLLYINNYVNTDNMCMFQSWYLAVDYHLFIIAPFFIYLLWKWPKIGKITLGTGIFVSVFIPFIITLIENLDPTLMSFAPEVTDLTQNFYFKNAYVKTHMRGGAYMLGILFGYILYKLQTKGSKISKHVVWFGWVFAAGCGISSMFSVVVFYDPSHQYNSLESAAYSALHRVAWCICIGWIVIICITKNSTLVNAFLTWKPFIVVSRLTYCAYLVNGFVELYSAGSVRNGMYMSKLDMTIKSLGHGLTTFFFAFLLCILFESPTHSLERMFLRGGGAKRQRSNTNNNEVNNATTEGTT